MSRSLTSAIQQLINIKKIKEEDYALFVTTHLDKEVRENIGHATLIGDETLLKSVIVQNRQKLIEFWNLIGRRVSLKGDEKDKEKKRLWGAVDVDIIASLLNESEIEKEEEFVPALHRALSMFLTPSIKEVTTLAQMAACKYDMSRYIDETWVDYFTIALINDRAYHSISLPSEIARESLVMQELEKRAFLYLDSDTMKSTFEVTITSDFIKELRIPDISNERKEIYSLIVDTSEFPNTAKGFLRSNQVSYKYTKDEPTYADTSESIDVTKNIMAIEDDELKYNKAFCEYTVKSQEKIESFEGANFTDHTVKYFMKRVPSWGQTEVDARISNADSVTEDVMARMLELAVLECYDAYRNSQGKQNGFQIMIAELVSLLTDESLITKIFDEISDGVRFDYAYYREVSRTQLDIANAIQKHCTKLKGASTMLESIFELLVVAEMSNYFNVKGILKTKALYDHTSGSVDKMGEMLSLLQCTRLIDTMRAYLKAVLATKDSNAFKGRQRMSKSVIVETLHQHRMALAAKMVDINNTADLLKTVLLATCVAEYKIPAPLRLKAPEIFELQSLNELRTIAQILYPALEAPEILRDALIWDSEAVHVRERIEQFYNLIKTSPLIELVDIQTFKEGYTIGISFNSERELASAYIVKNQTAKYDLRVVSKYASKRTNVVALAESPYREATKVFTRMGEPFTRLASSEFLVSVLDSFSRLTEGLNTIFYPKELDDYMFGTNYVTRRDLIAVGFTGGRFKLAHIGTSSEIFAVADQVFKEMSKLEATTYEDLAKQYATQLKYLTEMRHELFSVTGMGCKIAYTINISGKLGYAIAKPRPLQDYIKTNDALMYLLYEQMYNADVRYIGSKTKVWTPLTPEKISELSYYKVSNSKMLGVSVDIPFIRRKQILGHQLKWKYRPSRMVSLYPTEGGRFFDNSQFKGAVHTNIAAITAFINDYKERASHLSAGAQVDIVANDKIQTIYIDLIRQLLAGDARIFMGEVLSEVFTLYSRKLNSNATLLRAFTKQRIANEIAIETLRYISVFLDIVKFEDINHICDAIFDSTEYKLGDDFLNLRCVQN